jgi:hypothetical protein
VRAAVFAERRGTAGGVEGRMNVGCAAPEKRRHPNTVVMFSVVGQTPHRQLRPECVRTPIVVVVVDKMSERCCLLAVQNLPASTTTTTTTRNVCGATRAESI